MQLPELTRSLDTPYQIETRDQFPTLLNDLGLTGIAAEIGVQKGVYSKVLLDNWQGQKVYLVDAWRQFGTGREDFDNPDPNGQLLHFSETFKATYFHYDRAVIIKELSVEAAKLFPDKFFDFVYIDAAHDVENVQKDLNAWFRKVKCGGIFAGHDYYDGHVHLKNERVDEYVENRVKSVVDSFFAKLGLAVMGTTADLFPSWYVQNWEVNDE
jgi:hypothetical protein